MADNTQTGRPLQVITPLKPGALLLAGFSGHEGISELFDYQLDLMADIKTEVPFDKLLGQKVTVQLETAKGQKRYFSGICVRLSQGESNQVFTSFHMDVAPQLWLLSNRVQSRIFQHQNVPDILKKILKEEWKLDVVGFEKLGKFEPRDYVVQYRESDFNFVSRLMEEEGIYYFFVHSAGGHQMVLGNSSPDCPKVPVQSTINYGTQRAEGEKEQDYILHWVKRQELRPAKYTLWDHNFELPHKHLEADKAILDSVPVGQKPHKLKVGETDKLEIYDWPGGYAQRFDGVDKGGGDQADELKKIFQDNKRTVEIRMQQQQLPAVVIDGASNCRQFCAGHTFTVKTPGNTPAQWAKADGDYLLTHVAFTATQGSYRSGQGMMFHYHNTFVCIPLALRYRPLRTTPKPVISGTQTAVVVGPQGKEIFTDKYGRVKVQFHWDREGQYNADSSCWVRVAQVWAGKHWGASFWPRIGQEVVVAFEEGDSDRPIIVGSVYNAEQLPPYLGDDKNPSPDPKHKNDNKVSGIKTNTTLGGQGFNELRFDDTKDKQQVFIHAERDMDTRVKNENRELVLLNRHLIVGSEKDGKKQGEQRELVYKDKHLNVKGNHVEHIEGSMLLLVGGGDGSDPGNQDIIIKKNKKELIEENSHLHVKKNRNEQVDGVQSLTVGGTQHQKMGKGFLLEAGSVVHIKAGTAMVLEAGMQISLKVGGNFIDISAAGIAINGMPTVMINSGGAAASTDDAKPTAPEAPKEAKPTKPDLADDAKTGQKSAP